MAFCMNCGFKLPDGAKFCYECGHKQYKSPPPSPSGGIHDSVITGGHGGVHIGAPAVAGSLHIGDKKKECHHCGNIIGSDNKSVKCSVCGRKLCETCEGFFRDVKRSYGERPLCEQHYFERKEGWHKVGDHWENFIGMKFVMIPGKNYHFGKYTVTQKEWKMVMGSTPWKGKSYVKEGDDYPATYISWNDCQQFVKKLNPKEGRNIYHLPTEEEWEHACRGGSTTKFCFGDDVGRLRDYAWYNNTDNDRYGDNPKKVGQKRPNKWGLCDMHGNVWEWTSTSDGSIKVDRGGCWGSSAEYCESSYRIKYWPHSRYGILGVRIVRSSD